MAGGGTAVALEDRRIAEAIARCAEALGVPIVSAYLFGSRVEGRAHRESDLDLAVLLAPGRYAPGKELFEIRVALASALMAELHEDALDLIVLQEAPPHLARRIVTGGRRVFCADPDADAAFARDVQLRAADRAVPAADPRGEAAVPRAMTFLVERLAELRRHLDHLYELRPRIGGPEVLERDLSLHNDVLFSLLTVCQTVIDVAGELSARRGDRLEDHTQAVRNLARDERFSPELVRSLERLPGFRDVPVHGYVALDLARVVEAVDELEPIERFAAIVADIEAETSG